MDGAAEAHNHGLVDTDGPAFVGGTGTPLGEAASARRRSVLRHSFRFSN